MRENATWLLMYAVLPLLIAAAFFDWLCHRATKIEATSGLRENVVHWLMFGQIGTAVMVVAAFETNLAVLLWVGAAFALHELTVWLELRYTVDKREVRPIEQVVHSFMELLPLVAFALLVVLAAPDFALRLRREHWPAGYTFYTIAAVLLFNILPLAEETWRCFRRRTRPPPAPR